MPSENGWQPSIAAASQCEWITVPGTGVSLQLLKGHPLQIMRGFAADFNAFVEPLRDTDSAGWTPTNSVPTSNHLNGTAMDLNWNSHPFRVLNAGFTAMQIKTIRELLAFYEGTIFWGNDWDEPKDSMHFQMGYGSYNNPKTASFISRKIRSDGYSTFRRGPSTVAPKDVPAVDDDQKLDLIYQEMTKRFPSRSPLRHLGEGAVDTWAGMDLNVDAGIHILVVKALAELGDRDSLALLAEVAAADPNVYPGRVRDANLARAILQDIEASKPQVIANYLKGQP